MYTGHRCRNLGASVSLGTRNGTLFEAGGGAALAIDQIREFVTIADEGSFTRASAALNISQPALSKHMAALEKRLGSQLLVRSNVRTTLTPAGRVFYDDAQRILQDYDLAVAHLKEFRARPQASLTVESFQGYPPSDALLASLEADIRRERRNIELTLNDITSRSPLDNLRDGSSDLCLVSYLSGMNLAGLVESEVLLTDPLVAIVREDHPLADRGSIWIADIGSDVVWTYTSPGVRTYFSAAEELLLTHGANPQFVPLPWTNARQLYNSFAFFEGGIHVNLNSVVKYAAPMALRGYRVLRFKDEGACVPMRAVHRADDPNPALPVALASFRAAVERMGPDAYEE